MGSRLSSPGPQQRRFAAYIEGLANAAGHADRHTPLKNYCTGLLLPGERKSVEPMAARLAPDDVRRMHQSLHHLVADAPWNDEEMLAEARRYVLPTMQKQGPVVTWIVDDTGFPKQGKHSVGVARQYCGQLGIPLTQPTTTCRFGSWSSSCVTTRRPNLVVRIWHRSRVTIEPHHSVGKKGSEVRPRFGIFSVSHAGPLAGCRLPGTDFGQGSSQATPGPSWPQTFVSCNTTR